MKKLAKMLAAASVLALLSFGFFGCSEDDDDENEMISGSNNDYEINYTNDSDDTSRGYKTTTFKHRGATMEFTFTNASSTSASGVLGFIWDLEETDGKRSFYVLGIRQDSGKPSYYISKFTNVSDIGAYNFGTTASENPAVETLVVPGTDRGGDAVSEYFKYINSESWLDSDTDTVTVYADIAPQKGESNAYTGHYTVQFYKTEADATKAENGILTNAIDIPAYDTATMPQKTLAVYANVYQYKTFTGKWHFIGDYSEAEVIEDAE